ncbi:hypothetical protein KQ229_10150 [Lactobacillus helveticus]|jgi:uncharacterized membrane protein (DUF485 family)|uniref:Uncharacterized protein n=2 Tax=Lactobacillus helveticus TaxID=1587 RepID=A0A0D5MH18_LACHE|nr:hypothetical protein [Lactobacillus helveticus]AJY60858.1 hypothetical protein HUO_02245 [Lactobacillus helveticus]ALI51905.1 hypothetical protein ALV80_01290 [Lactobacillus helveticus]ANZ55660.1 hypothetical protein BCM45_03575 [Lactobacillus helveticus]AQY53769.1 hypothetical protein BCM44_06780 [Lactobacillus helveticus]AUI73480.1 hypothetical protein Lh8105_00470 [Lactobacillus helveticus]
MKKLSKLTAQAAVVVSPLVAFAGAFLASIIFPNQFSLNKSTWIGLGIFTFCYWIVTLFSYLKHH